jgi:hypothetical protein
MDFIKEYASVFSLLVGGLAGAILNAIVSHARRDKFILGRKVISRIVIEQKDPDVSISFKNRPVQRVDQQEILLKNIGNKIIENLLITIEVSGDILEKKLEKPRGATFSLEPSPDNEKQLLLNCDYINPNDLIVVHITEADSTINGADVVARGKKLEIKALDKPKGKVGKFFNFLYGLVMATFIGSQIYFTFGGTVSIIILIILLVLIVLVVIYVLVFETTWTINKH